MFKKIGILTCGVFLALGLAACKQENKTEVPAQTEAPDSASSTTVVVPNPTTPAAPAPAEPETPAPSAQTETPADSSSAVTVVPADAASN